MTEPRTSIPDSLLKRALVERASGPAVDLLPGILATAGAIRQRRGWVVGFERSRRPLAIGLIAAALLIALVGTVLVGAGILWLRSEEGPFRGNGPIVVSNGGMVAIDPNTGHVIDRLPIPSSEPFGGLAWSPYGDRLAMSDARGVLLFDPANGTTRSLVSCTYCSVSWTPDGARLAMGQRGEIALVDSADGHKIDSVSVPGIQVLSISWEPTGGRIAFTGRTGDRVRLYVVDRDGSNLRALDGPFGDFSFGDVVWSPAGDAIAYMRFVPLAGDQNGPALNDLLIMRVDPDRPAPPSLIIKAGQCFCVGFSPGLGWSPDGRQLAVTSLGTVMDAGLYLVDADGSDFHLIAKDASGTPAWRPVP